MSWPSVAVAEDTPQVWLQPHVRSPKHETIYLNYTEHPSRTWAMGGDFFQSIGEFEIFGAQAGYRRNYETDLLTMYKLTPKLTLPRP
jgi:hypothetical protein